MCSEVDQKNQPILRLKCPFNSQLHKDPLFLTVPGPQKVYFNHCKYAQKQITNLTHFNSKVSLKLNNYIGAPYFSQFQDPKSLQTCSPRTRWSPGRAADVLRDWTGAADRRPASTAKSRSQTRGQSERETLRPVSCESLRPSTTIEWLTDWDSGSQHKIYRVAQKSKPLPNDQNTVLIRIKACRWH